MNNFDNNNKFILPFHELDHIVMEYLGFDDYGKLLSVNKYYNKFIKDNKTYGEYYHFCKKEIKTHFCKKEIKNYYTDIYRNCLRGRI